MKQSSDSEIAKILNRQKEKEKAASFVSKITNDFVTALNNSATGKQEKNTLRDNYAIARRGILNKTVMLYLKWESLSKRADQLKKKLERATRPKTSMKDRFEEACNKSLERQGVAVVDPAASIKRELAEITAFIESKEVIESVDRVRNLYKAAYTEELYGPQANL